MRKASTKPLNESHAQLTWSMLCPGCTPGTLILGIFQNKPKCFLGYHILSLPPAFQRNGEGTVFTGVCLFTFQGVPPSGWWVVHLPSWQEVPPSFPIGGGTGQGGTPIPGQDRGVPQPEQHSVYLLCGGRYASCVHAGGLSCFCAKKDWIFKEEMAQMTNYLSATCSSCTPFNNHQKQFKKFCEVNVSPKFCKDLQLLQGRCNKSKSRSF